VEEGTHDSLLAQNGKYAEMWRVQAGRYEVQ
jgi:ATP-binding cassette subfamily B protein